MSLVRLLLRIEALREALKSDCAPVRIYTLATTLMSIFSNVSHIGIMIGLPAERVNLLFIHLQCPPAYSLKESDNKRVASYKR